MKAAGAALVLFAAALSGTDAMARSAALDQGRKLFDDLEFEKAIPLLSQAATDARASKVELLEAHELLAYAYIALGREAEGLETFVKLLRIDRSFSLKPSTSPKVKAVFERARRLVPDAPTLPAAPALSHVPVSTARPGGVLRIDLVVADPSKRVRSATLRHRLGRAPFTSLQMKEVTPGRFASEIPLPTQRMALEYYFLARDERGITIAALRDEESPFRVESRKEVIPVRPTAAAPVWKKWWFWTAVGGAVAATTISLTVLARSSDSSTTSDFGRVRLIVK